MRRVSSLKIVFNKQLLGQRAHSSFVMALLDPASPACGRVCLASPNPRRMGNKWVEKQHTPTYKEWRPKRPRCHEELRVFLRFTETHHRRCLIKGFPRLESNLYELVGETVPPPVWSWTTYCGCAFRKIEGHIFLYQVLDGVDFRCSHKKVLLHAPTTIAGLKEWFALVRDSGATASIHTWLKPVFLLLICLH